MNRTHSPLERVSLAAAAAALSLATLSMLVVAPAGVQESTALAAAAPAHPVQAVVDVKYLSYEPAARLQRSGA